MANEVQIKRDSKLGIYTATYNGRTLWIKHNYIGDTWDILEPWVYKSPDGFYKSKWIDSYGRLYRAKEAVTRILKGN